MLKDGVTLYFVRHGETDWNAVQRYQGQTDTPLNDKGRQQATRNGQMLKQLIGADRDPHFVASPLSRTFETMAIIRRQMGRGESDFATDPRLKEINFGHWEGQLWSELPMTDPVEFEARRNNPFHWRPRGGESYGDLAARIAGWLREIDRDTVVVSHGGVSRVVRMHILSLPESQVARLEVPQDKIMVLKAGQLEWA